MSTEKIRIRIKAYDHRVLDNAAKKIVETVRRSGGVISGPVPLPTEIEKFTIDELSHITDNESLLSEVIENFNQKNREMLLENSKFIESVKLSLGAIRANIKKTDDITRQRFFSSQEEEALASLQSAECERSEICSRIKMNSEELKNLLKISVKYCIQAKEKPLT